MAVSGRAALDRLMRAAGRPAAAQAGALAAILKANRDTTFGRAHGFAGIAGPDAWRAAAPIVEYEDLRPWIERQIADEAALVAERPLMYARTSGTTAAPKYLPVTPTGLAQMKRAQRVMSFVQHRACRLFSGRILALGGARCEETLAGGVPAGSVTGLIYETMPAVVRRKYVVPPEVFSIADAELKYAAVTRLALQHADLTAVSTANPSTLLRLRDHSRANWGKLLAEVADGTFAGTGSLTPAQARAMTAALFPAPERARALARAAEPGEPSIAALWPNLAGVVTWTGGSCALAAAAVRRSLAPETLMIDAGYVASELRGTVVVDARRNLALPLLEDTFYEFVEADDWEAGRRDTRLAHELEPGRDYQVIITTTGGLYRYRINDILRAGPIIGATPTLSFQRKGRGVTNITGEKLSETQINLALAEAAAPAGCDVLFHLVLADEDRAVYVAWLEVEGAGDDLAQDVERALVRLNIEYAAKRRSGRLAPVEVRRLRPGAGAAYRRWCVAGGQRDSQFKVLTLQTARECGFDFTPWRLEEGAYAAEG
ncbi:GH3 auxin-responsive promoter family protein [Brevundimonas sp.]|uniref:GH3 auxin-responsive promoter family protein n=1 Tax=Brevundimonas sp. TaxID=1871086 RepID=UPI002737A23B|nr:GH3 auxin-responsive promoter family protein [Brevundimonas sp.]MDP3801077.1 GH3 auxin-responsive promoter family protein [Brevundimonas sp.]